MLFSDVKRVIFKKNPLVQVICQLRFPRILLINEKPPSGFQERIRAKYPIFNSGVEQLHQFVMGQGMDVSPKFVQNEQSAIYSFSSDDGVWQINLTSTYLALITTEYKRWEDFLSRLQEPLSALMEEYSPAFFERVGLRYVDAYSRSKLSIDSQMPWVDLFKPFILGFLSNNEIADEVKGYTATTELNIGKGAEVRVVTSTGFIGDEAFKQDPEVSFIVDSDFSFNMRKTQEELNDSLEYLHENASRLINNIITDNLYSAMEPEEI